MALDPAGIDLTTRIGADGKRHTIADVDNDALPVAASANGRTTLNPTVTSLDGAGTDTATIAGGSHQVTVKASGNNATTDPVDITFGDGDPYRLATTETFQVALDGGELFGEITVECGGSAKATVISV